MKGSIDDRALLDLVEVIYEAACDPSGWRNFITRLHAEFPQAMVSKHVSIENTTIEQFSSWAGISDDAAGKYFRTYQFHNEFLPIISKLPVGKSFQRSEIATTAWVKSQTIYNEWLLPAGRFLYGASLTIARDERRLARLTLEFPDTSEHLEAVAAVMLDRIRSHMRRAFDLNDRICGQALTQQTLMGVLEKISGAAYVLRANGGVYATNKSGETMARRGGIVRIGADNQLSFRSAGYEERFREALRNATNVSIDSSAGPFQVLLSENVYAIASVIPLRVASQTLSISSSPPSLALLTIHLPEIPRSAQSILTEHYRLTPAELEIAELVGSGISIADAADVLIISKSTARNQLAAVMQKLGLRRQSELVAFISKLTPSLCA